MRRVVCPGSFDPVTNGHLDIIRRAARLHDEVLVVVGANLAKEGLFTVEERLAHAPGGHQRPAQRHAWTSSPACWWISAATHDVSAIVKGLRAVSDFEYEMEMAQMNYRLAEVETLFMTANPLYSFLRSSLVKEIAKYGGDVTPWCRSPCTGGCWRGWRSPDRGRRRSPDRGRCSPDRVLTRPAPAVTSWGSATHWVS